MRCPECGSPVTYYYQVEPDVEFEESPYDRCANCGAIFDRELEGLDDNELFVDPLNKEENK